MAKKYFEICEFHQMAGAVWLYFIAKVVELLDTVFFVLRKRTRQITFLHLYHHTMMPICSFVGVKYMAGESTEKEKRLKSRNIKISHELFNTKRFVNQKSAFLLS